MKKYLYRFRTWHSVLSIVALTCCILFTTFSLSEGVQPQVAAGVSYTVGLRSDGTVVAVGQDYGGQLDVSSWTGITQVAAGAFHAVGLRSDGTVVAVGEDYGGQLSSWTGITQVAAGAFHTVGLRSDGTVVAVGYNEYGELDVSSWDLGVAPQLEYKWIYPEKTYMGQNYNIILKVTNLSGASQPVTFRLDHIGKSPDDSAWNWEERGFETIVRRNDNLYIGFVGNEVSRL